MAVLTQTNENSRKHEEIAEYWDEETRNNAIPKPMPILDVPPPGDGDAPQEDQEIVHVPPNVSIDQRDDEGSDASATATIAQPVVNPASWPRSCNGKLFFTWKGGNYVGSAGSIYLEILLTAAHNIYDEGEWSDNFLYYPSYASFGSWGWSRAAIFTAWRDNTNYAYDYAMIRTNRSMSQVGSLGYVTGVSPTGRTWTSYGYPARAPFPGTVMYQATGSCVSNTGGVVAMNNNDMTQGSSGGNWITNYNGTNAVNGVNSHGYASQPSTMYGPNLSTSEFNILLNCAAYGSCK